MSDSLRRAWAQQTAEAPPPLEPARLRADSERLDRQVRRRNALEYAAGVVVAATFAAAAAVESDPLRRVAAAMIVVGVGSVMVTLARRGSAVPLPEALGAPTLAWRRAELARQRDLLAGVWRWYLGPLVPGMGLLVGVSLYRATTPFQVAVAVATGVIGAGVFAAVGRMNRAAAAELARELAELDAVEGEIAPDP